jgi:hypothetical protein
VACILAGTVSQGCQRVVSARILNGCAGVDWDNKLFQEWWCTGKAMSNTRQCPSRTGSVSKELQLSSD